MTERTYCGFVAVLGAPNAGKSTLVNRAVGAKVTIVSPKPQTTRRRVMGVAMRDEAQIVFIDTPGIFAPRRRLYRAMVAAAWGSLEEADVILVIVDSSLGDPLAKTEPLLRKLQGTERPVWLILNKIDQLQRQKLLNLVQEFNRRYPFAETFMISAENGDGVEDLLKSLRGKMPQGPYHFPPDQLTDLPMRLLAAEVTREQLFLRLHQELPYSLAVETERWQEFDNGSVKIDQIILVERESQRPIILGQGGRQIKAVREASQRALEAFMNRKVHLFLTVKVHESWQEDRGHFQAFGLSYDS